MVDFFKRRLAANSELSNSWSPFERSHVVDDGFDLIGIEIEPLNFKGLHSLLDLFVRLHNVFLSSFDQQLTGYLEGIALLI